MNMVKIIQLFWLKCKVLSFVIIFFIVVNNCNAQYVRGNEFVVKSSSYIEIGGNGLWVSVNYDRILIQKNLTSLAARVGLSYLGYCNTVSLPVTFSILYGKEDYFLEIGSGPTVHSYYPGINTGVSFQGLIGLRYQQLEEKGVMVRIIFTPIIAKYNVKNGGERQAIIPLVGLSVGYSF